MIVDAYLNPYSVFPISRRYVRVNDFSPEEFSNEYEKKLENLIAKISELTGDNFQRELCRFSSFIRLDLWTYDINIRSFLDQEARLPYYTILAKGPNPAAIINLAEKELNAIAVESLLLDTKRASRNRRIAINRLLIGGWDSGLPNAEILEALREGIWDCPAEIFTSILSNFLLAYNYFDALLPQLEAIASTPSYRASDFAEGIDSLLTMGKEELFEFTTYNLALITPDAYFEVD